MALLLPTDFDLADLPAESERAVCRAFLERLDDTWYVIPQVPIVVDHHDHEIDVLLVSPTKGVFAVEVKGGLIDIVEGRWRQNGQPLKKSPVSQVVGAKHALVRRLKSAGVDLEDLFIQHLVALPDVGSVPAEGLGPDAPAERIFTKTELAFPQEALELLDRRHRPVPPDRFQRFLGAIRRDIVLDGHEGKVLHHSRRQLDDETCLHLTTAVSTDANRRVLVTGGAGTGKTMLTVDWAVRACDRGERTLVVCFNRPIAEFLARQLDGCGATVGTFHHIAVQLLEPHGFVVGENPPPEYWADVVPQALEVHAARIGRPFDTVIVDEGQDFHAHWFTALDRLLDPSSSGRLLVAADPAQAVYLSDWSPPSDVMVSTLVFNLRNCRRIADVVHRQGGPAPLPSAPDGDAVRFHAVRGDKEVRKRVRDTVVRLTGELGLAFGEIAVLTTRTATRDALLGEPIDGCPLTRWEQRSEEAVLCETVHRTKGLEKMAVILVDQSEEPNEVLLYVGASRAVASLTVVGSMAVGEALGLVGD